ncbi:TetR/AcrR family transcriptional regulator [Streptococcus dentapri]|uniref:TetR/AcrR family transcriptional regulator n=1 Tax=Streptococcus dentapri TaxID=573564 RepID=A0ABV8D105_9STRE
MKQEEKSFQTQRKIKQAALSLFAEKGYQKTKMSDIVDVTALSKGAVYHHFKSKKEILRQLMMDEMNELNQQLELLASQTYQSAKKRLINLVDNLITNQSLQKLTTINWAEKVPFGLLRTLRNTVNHLTPYVEWMIEQGNQQGEFNCPYPFETASVFLILVDVWLDPIIAEDPFTTLAKKIDYIAFYLEQSGLSIISAEKSEEIKKALKFMYKGGDTSE